MNNEDMKLQINPEFENMIPELTDDELSQLEENILTEGTYRCMEWGYRRRTQPI